MTLQQLIHDRAAQLTAGHIDYHDALELEAQLFEFAEDVVRLSRQPLRQPPQLTGAPSRELYEALSRGQSSSR